jgi:AcrR family transcriptional regulator
VTDRAAPLTAPPSEDAPAADERAGSTDGRAARRARNRTAVLDAAIALFAEGNLQPTAGDIAARSGVSHRSINRYFPDNRALVRVRLDAYEVLGATARASAVMSATSRIVRTELAAVRDLLTGQVDLQFAAELAALPEARRESGRAAVDALFQFESLDFYRRLRGLSPATAHALLAQTLRDLLVSS